MPSSSAEGDDLLKLRTPETEVRGRGHVVVRRTGTTTLVMAMAGAFRVETTKGLVLSVAQGQGVVAPAEGSPDGPNDLPACRPSRSSPAPIPSS